MRQRRQHRRQPLAEVVVARPHDVGDADEADEDRAGGEDPQHDRHRRGRLVRGRVAVIVVRVRVVRFVGVRIFVAVRLDDAGVAAAIVAGEDEEVETEHVERRAAGGEQQDRIEPVADVDEVPAVVAGREDPALDAVERRAAARPLGVHDAAEDRVLDQKPANGAMPEMARQ